MVDKCFPLSYQERGPGGEVVYTNHNLKTHPQPLLLRREGEQNRLYSHTKIKYFLS